MRSFSLIKLIGGPKNAFKKNEIVAMLSVVALILVIPFHASAAAGTIYESTGNNNSYTSAEVTYDDYDNYGTIASTTDVDWWEITMTSNGLGNIWLGNIPAGCNYDIYVYDIDGAALLAKSVRTRGTQEYVRVRFYANIPVYVKVVSVSGYSASAQYLLRFKNYPVGEAGTFGYQFDDLNTTVIRQSATNLATHGFTSQYYVDNSATDVGSDFSTSQIMIISSHGAPGRMSCDGGSYLFASTKSARRYIDFAIDSLAAGSMQGMRLIVFDGCTTGIEDEEVGWGNLVDSAIAKGADVAIGWNFPAPSPTAEAFYNQFTSYLNGVSVAQAIDDAQDWAASMVPDVAESLRPSYQALSQDANINVGGRPGAVNLA